MDQRKVMQDVFESLFHEYNEIHTRPLPRFKKKRKKPGSQPAEGDEAATSASAIAASTSLPNLRVCPAENHHERMAFSHQGSFSSGVYSMDSDLECPATEGDREESVTRGKRRTAPVLQQSSETSDNCKEDGSLRGQECNRMPQGDSDQAVGRAGKSVANIADIENGQSDDDLSEASSGYACRDGGRENDDDNGDVSMTTEDEQMKPCSLGCAQLNEGEEKIKGTEKLTDEDVLFMMHKPRVKKKMRRKPPWQKKKLDLDELWLRGQHRWSIPSGERTTEAIHRKLFLNRNLERGKIHLKIYMRLMRTSWKGRRLLKHIHGKASRRRSRDRTHTQTAAGGKEADAREKRGGMKDTGRNQENVKETKKISRTSLSKNMLSKNDRYMQTSSTSAASQDEGNRGNKQEKQSRMSRRGGSGVDSCVSKGLKPHARIKRSIACSGLSSAKVGRSSAKNRPPTDFDVKLDVDFDSESEGSLINFIGLTPRKSSKQSRSKRRERRSSAAPVVERTLSHESNPNPGVSRERTSLAKVVEAHSQKVNTKSSLSRKQEALLGSGGGLLLSDESSDWDGLLPSYSPLFGQTRHCGGVWKSIVEESS